MLHLTGKRINPPPGYPAKISDAALKSNAQGLQSWDMSQFMLNLNMVQTDRKRFPFMCRVAYAYRFGFLTTLVSNPVPGKETAIIMLAKYIKTIGEKAMTA